MLRRPALLACIGLGGGAAGLALATFGPASTGCTTHQCDQSFYEWFPEGTLPDGGPGGFMQDENTYVSNDLDSPWLIFHGNTTVKLWFPPEVAGRRAEIPVVGVGIDDTPNSLQSLEEGGNYTTGIGQLALFNYLSTIPTNVDGGQCTVDGGTDGGLDGGSACGPGYYGGSVEITNSSCASYFMTVAVHFSPDEMPVQSPSIDSGGSILGAGVDTGAAVIDSSAGLLAEASAGDAGGALDAGSD